MSDNQQHITKESQRSPKLEVSFLLNNSTQSGASNTEYLRTSNRQDAERRSNTGGTSTGSNRRYRCDACPAAFAQSHDLAKHKRTVHEKLRPFKCDICHKSFGEKGNLSKHKKSVHLNERPFTCSTCGSSFAFKDGLHRHMTLVHFDMRPFKCDKCGADFKQVSQLRKHSCVSHSNPKR